MAGFFDRMLGRGDTNKGSSSRAKDRLQFVLLHERMDIPPEKMREMKAEILDVIAKYVPEIDRDSVEVQVEQSDRYQNKLVAEIPFTKRPVAASDADADEESEADASNDRFADDETPDDDPISNLHEQETRRNPPVDADDEPEKPESDS